jgi:hypothetical protein
VEISQVRKRLQSAVERARKTARERREHVSAAERAYDVFLANVATPVTRMLATALKAEGYLFTVNTPGGSVRLASDRGRDEYIDIAFDAGSRPPAAREPSPKSARSSPARHLTPSRRMMCSSSC